MYNRAMIVVDTELSGLDPAKDSILSIGAVELENPANTFYGECRVWDGAHVHDEALAVNGFTREQAYDPNKPSEAQLIASFIEWAEKANDITLAGQAPSSDYAFLKGAAARAHINWPFAHRTLDSHSICYAHMTLKGMVVPMKNKHSDLNLEKVAAYSGIPPEPLPHNALNGAKTCAEAIYRMLYNKPLLPEYQNYPLHWLK